MIGICPQIYGRGKRNPGFLPGIFTIGGENCRNINDVVGTTSPHLPAKSAFYRDGQAIIFDR
jgi:hypothetical protein